MTTKAPRLREQIVAVTHEWIRNCGLDIQDVEAFVDRELMSLFETTVMGIIGKDDVIVPGVTIYDEWSEHCNELRKQQRKALTKLMEEI